MDDESKRMQFIRGLEPAIAEANRQAVHGQIPKVDKDCFLRFAVSVARARAHYLGEAMRFAAREHGEELDSAEVQRLRDLRERYEEALKAYDALAHAVERGYVEVDTTT